MSECLTPVLKHEHRWVVPYTAPGIRRGRVIVRATTSREALVGVTEIHTLGKYHLTGRNDVPMSKHLTKKMLREIHYGKPWMMWKGWMSA